MICPKCSEEKFFKILSQTTKKNIVVVKCSDCKKIFYFDYINNESIKKQTND